MRALAAASAVAMAASPALADENPLFFQATVATQAHPSFHAPYSGMNSLHPEAESALSVVMDLGARIHPWIGAEIVVQPELAGGRGLSSTLGVAAYPSGEVYRIGNPEPALILAKLSLRQTAGAAVVFSALSAAHRAYLASGGYGFLIGDGALRYGGRKSWPRCSTGRPSASRSPWA